MKIIQSILTQNDCYKANRKIKVKGLMLHSVGCSQPSASVFVKNWNKSGVTKCTHGIIDANTGEVYQTLPWDYRGWHAGGAANDTHIGVEMCEPDCITYTKGANFTCSDLTRAKAFAKRAYESAVELFAYLCKTHGLDPLTDIISHKEGHKRGIASNHGDPEHLWKGLGMGYTMDTFRKAVRETMNNGKEEKVMYYVQVPFENKSDADAILNAFKVLGVNCTIVAPNVKPAPTNVIKVGSTVRVKQGAKTYTGGGMASFVYTRDHVVKEIKGDRVVITYNGAVVAAVNEKDLVLV